MFMIGGTAGAPEVASVCRSKGIVKRAGHSFYWRLSTGFREHSYLLGSQEKAC